MPGTLSATITPAATSQSCSAAFTATGTLASNIAPTYSVSAALAGAGSLSATMYRTAAVAAALAGSGTLSATGTAKIPIAAAFTATGSLSAATGAALTAPFTGTGTLSATGVGIIPVTFDTVGAGNSNTTAATTLSWSHNSTAGSYAVAAIITNAVSSSISSVTYGGAAMTLLATLNNNNGAASNGILRIYGLATVSGGTQTVTLTGSSNLWTANSASYKNVNSTGTPTTAFGSGSGLSQAATCATNQMIVQAFGTSSGSSFSGLSGGTNRDNRFALGRGMILNDSPSNATFAATHNTSGAWSGIAVVLNP